jgi:hypothetical protein
MPAPIMSGPNKPVDGKKPTRADEPIINEEADRILGRMSLQTLIPLVLVMLLPPAMASINIKNSPLYRYHQPLDIASILIVLVVWYAMNARLFAKRLDIGRDLAGKRQWKQAVACLLPFDSFGQRFLDRSGEAHYLLAQPYAGTGDKPKADKCRQFVLKYRPGPWAAKLGGKPAPVVRKTTDDAPDQPKPRPPKSKPKRRF